MISLRVSTGTIAELDRRRKAVEKARLSLEDRKELMAKIKQDMVQEWAKDFQSGGDPAWAPTSASYQRTRIREGYSPTPTLRRSGALEANFYSQNQAGRINAASVTWNFRNAMGEAYPVSHHTGYTLGSSNVPARQLWDITGDDESRISKLVEDFVAQRLLAALG